MNNIIITNCKEFINDGNLKGLQDYYNELQNMEYDYSPNWQYIYRQIYIHSCLKKKRDIADWLTNIFQVFDPVSQIALRQIFPYGRYLLSVSK
jgi:hypothetical protein